MYDLVPFSRWSQAAKKLERKWETDVPAEIKKRGWVRFFSPLAGDYTFCLLTNKSGTKTYSCGWAKRFHDDEYSTLIAQKVSFNRAVEDLFSYIGYE